MTLSSHLTRVYLPVSPWADIASVGWRAEVDRASRRRGREVRRGVFTVALQTAERRSDSPACLAASCFKGVWTLGLCGSSEGGRSRAVLQTGVTACAELLLLSAHKAADKVPSCWCCVTRPLSCKGSNGIRSSDSSAGSLGTSLPLFGREWCNPVTLCAESEPIFPCQPATRTLGLREQAAA